MTNPQSSSAKHWAPVFIAVCLVAVNMRMTITGVGPLLDDLAADEGMTPAALGILSSLPLIIWAVVSPLAHGVANRIGLDRTVNWALVALIVATAWRSLPGPAFNLWFGTALLGAGLAVTNVLLPASIKRDFSTRVPLVMGAYSALIGLSAAIGAGMVVPIAHHLTAGGEALGWRWALLATGAALPIASIAWARATKRARTAAAPEGGSATAAGAERAGSGIWRDPVAWLVTLYMGAQSWVFYTLATWVAPIDISHGANPVTAGFNVTVMHLCGILGSLLAPLLWRGTMRRVLPLLLPIMAVVGSGGIVFLPDAQLLWVVICGLSVGGSLTVALTFIAERTMSTSAAGALSGMAQAVGYLIASIGPMLFGWIFDASGAWALSLTVIVAGSALQFGIGLALWRERMVFAPAAPDR